MRVWLTPGEGSAPDGSSRFRDFVERLQAVEADPEELAALFGLGELDLAVVYDAQLARLRDSALDRAPALRRLPSWDRTYFLWLNVAPGMRWTRDPAFRDWLVRTVDRATLVRDALGGAGEPAWRLPRRRAEAPPAPPSQLWRVPSRVRPRIELCFDGADPVAARLASALRRGLEAHRLDITLELVDAQTLSGRLVTGGFQAVLLAHQPLDPDPTVALAATLARLGPQASDALERSAQESDSVGRHRLIPLVTAHAWLATAPGLRGVRGAPGELKLDRMRWSR